ncbi:MAG: hypothetical protein ACI81R_002697 [Bradymonadia bacterium]|jgi:hypothetical protein
MGLRGLIVLFAATLLGGCQFGYGPDSGVGFSCTQDADCLSNYVCRGFENGVGRCALDDEVERDCVDEDNDGAFVGPDCTDQVLDCDDASAQIRPGVDEACDGVDNNCSCDRTDGDTNGDGTVCGAGDEGVDEEIVPRPCPLQSASCAGAQAECVNGEFQDCALDGLYDAQMRTTSGRDDISFERTEESCDAFDNDCDGQQDETCECAPGERTAQECGKDTGPCTRGVEICGEDGTFGECVEARVGTVCEDDGAPCATGADCSGAAACVIEGCEASTDCNDGAYCTTETIRPEESLADGCTPENEDSTDCQRSVCRYLDSDVACESAVECGTDAACIAGFCQPLTIDGVAETCNGVDDDCNGRIDGGSNWFAVCGACPFNAEFVDYKRESDGRSDFICVERYEASRPDATADDAGVDGAYARSIPGVQPWTGLSAEEAAAACSGEEYSAALGQRAAVAPRVLCTGTQWRQACGGKDDSSEEVAFPYSESRADDEFVEGNCLDASVVTELSVTGSAANCCLDGICDAVGNAAEYVTRANGQVEVAGGSFDDITGNELTCAVQESGSYFPVPEDVSDVGFRCCALPRNP